MRCHRRLAHQEGARHLRGAQAAQQPQRQRDLRLRRDGRVAACEDQSQPIVGDLVRGDLLGFGLDLIVEQQWQRSAPRRLTAQQVQRTPSRDRGEPRTRIRRNAARGPRRQGFRVSVLHTLLGEVEISGDAHRRGEHEGPLATVCLSDRGSDRGVRGHELVRQSNSITGRTSTPPNGAGTCLATAIASSRSVASMM